MKKEYESLIIRLIDIDERDLITSSYEGSDDDLFEDDNPFAGLFD